MPPADTLSIPRSWPGPVRAVVKYFNIYRVSLIEAGHVCQTFCLVATSLGLAPFSTMALADSKVEKTLGIDGINESILYSAGVGHRPKDIDWAPWHSGPRGRRVPNLAMHGKQRRF